ncbi:hypothetical protein M514_00384 [Trichuris suis]|uniref:Uncharacterized protein n=1 Tax=Trichuris suis TaxID=68888 RepID=A0A085NR77_9BILA|nr:hypothetical protein M513_00384 [Trichuris suis]KFD71973.1 hypothetical protein M514_00384 [Trichuris suis]KHJ44084.1 hypothetical protein D918_05778 [Trichuris suis]
MIFGVLILPVPCQRHVEYLCPPGNIPQAFKAEPLMDRNERSTSVGSAQRRASGTGARAAAALSEIVTACEACPSPRCPEHMIWDVQWHLVCGQDKTMPVWQFWEQQWAEWPLSPGFIVPENIGPGLGTNRSCARSVSLCSGAQRTCQQAN